MLHKSNIYIAESDYKKGRAQSLGELSRRTFSNLIRRSSAEDTKKQNECTESKKCEYPYYTISKEELVAIMKEPNVIIIDTRETGTTNQTQPQTYHHNHIRLAINFEVPLDATREEIIAEISHNDSIKPLLMYTSKMKYELILYDQYGLEESSSHILYNILQSFHGGFERIRILEGGFASFEQSFSNLCGASKDLRTPFSGGYFFADDNIFDEITPGLFLGRQLCDDEYELLERMNVAGVLSITTKAPNVPEHFKTFFIQLEDNNCESIYSYFEESNQFIESCLSSGNAVYIHCTRGLSRSPTIVLAYLMKRFSISVRQALTIVKSRRPNVGPQANFMRQLLIYELELGFSAIPSLPLHLYILNEAGCEHLERSCAFIIDTETTKPTSKKTKRLCDFLLFR